MNKYFPVVEGATLSIGASRDLLFRTIRTRPESKFIFEISEKTFQVIKEVRYRGDLVTLCHGDPSERSSAPRVTLVKRT